VKIKRNKTTKKMKVSWTRKKNLAKRERKRRKKMVKKNEENRISTL